MLLCDARVSEILQVENVATCGKSQPDSRLDLLCAVDVERQHTDRQGLHKHCFVARASVPPALLLL